MNRRNFIHSAALATGALSLSSFRSEIMGNRQAGERQAAVSAFRKSIMWGTVGLHGSVLDKCKAIQAAGYEGIEPNSHMDRQEVIAALKETGLVASGVCCSTHWDKPLSHPDAAVRKEGLEGMITALEDAKAYQTDAVLLVPGVVNEEVTYQECWERSVEGIQALLPTARKLGVCICLENVWNNFLLSPQEACQYVDQFDSPYVGFYFDCGNILRYGWPEQWISQLGSRIKRIHIKEFSRKKMEEEGIWKGFDVALTEGSVNWKRVMEEARKHYKGGWLTTEQGSSSTPEALWDLNLRLDRIISL